MNILERFIKTIDTMLTMNFQIYFSLFPLSQLLILPLGYKPLQFGPYNKCTRFNYALISIFRLNVYILYVLSVCMYLGLFISVFLDFNINLYKLQIEIGGKKSHPNGAGSFEFCVLYSCSSIVLKIYDTPPPPLNWSVFWSQHLLSYFLSST